MRSFRHRRFKLQRLQQRRDLQHRHRRHPVLLRKRKSSSAMSFSRILVTGVSGASTSECLHRLQTDLGKERVEVHNVGHEIMRLVRESGMSLESGNILNAPKDTLTALRVAAFERILPHLNGSQKIHLVDVHATFLMRSGLKEGLSFNEVKKFAPDLMLTIIDAPQQINRRLREHPGKYLHLTVADIVKWQEFEVYVTNMVARILGVRHFVVAESQTETLKTILSDLDRKPPVYASYPMTHLPEEEKPKIRRFVEFLKERFTVFDPAAIDSSHDLSPHYSEEDKRAISNHTIVRDLEWMIGINSDKVVAYLPRIVFSSGMNDELRFGHETGKETYIVLEHHDPTSLPLLSPFTEYKSRVFWSLDDFRYYLDLAPSLRNIYDGCEEKILELIKEQKLMHDTVPILEPRFRSECHGLWKYLLKEDQYTRMKPAIDDVIAYILQKWHPQSTPQDPG
jgi:adenylate kinase